MCIVVADHPSVISIMEGQTVRNPMGDMLGRSYLPDLEFDPVAAFQVKPNPIKGKKHFK